MSNKKVTMRDIQLNTRAGRRHLQRQEAKRLRKETIEDHNEKFKPTIFNHKLERRSKRFKEAV